MNEETSASIGGLIYPDNEGAKTMESLLLTDGFVFNRFPRYARGWTAELLEQVKNNSEYSCNIYLCR